MICGPSVYLVDDDEDSNVGIGTDGSTAPTLGTDTFDPAQTFPKPVGQNVAGHWTGREL